MTTARSLKQAAFSIVAPVFSPNSLKRFTRTLVDFGFLLLFAFAPLFMGGRHPLGIEVYVCVIFGITVLCCIQQLIWPVPRKTNPLDFIILAATLVMVAQLIPIPSSALNWISPDIRTTLPLWNESIERDATNLFGGWHTLSLTPGVTRTSLALWIAYGLLYYSTTLHLRDIPSIYRILKQMGWCCFACAALAIIQCLMNNGKFLWIYEHPYRVPGNTAQGTFANPNHFAHFVALGIGPILMGLTKRFSQHRCKLPTQNPAPQFVRLRRLLALFKLPPQAPHQLATVLLPVVLVGTVVGSGILSNSRGGVLVHALALIIAFALIFTLARKHGQESRYILAGFGFTILVASILVFVQGHGSILRELESATTVRSLDSLEDTVGRGVPWTATLNALPSYWPIGSGAGSFREVYKTHSDSYASCECTHAESGYLQIALETGSIGVILLVAAIVVIAWWVKKAMAGKNSAIVVAVLPGLLISLVHSLVDFVWYIPACATLTIVLIASLYQFVQHQEGGGSGSRQNLPAQNSSSLAAMPGSSFMSIPLLNSLNALKSCSSLLAMPALLVFLALLFPRLLSPIYQAARGNVYWEDYLKDDLSQAFHSKPKATLDPLTKIQQLDQSINNLRLCLESDPQHARAHLRLAEALLHRFELEQNLQSKYGLTDLADVGSQVGFESTQEVSEWLTRLAGEHQELLFEASAHALLSAQLSPLSGEGYLIVAQLSFLYPSAELSQPLLVDQALTTRPHDGEILFLAASISRQWGETDQTFGYLRQALRKDPKIRRQIVQQIGPTLTADEFIDKLDPDRTALAQLAGIYFDIGRRDESEVCADLFFADLDQEYSGLEVNDQSRLLKQAIALSLKLGRDSQTLALEKRALKLSPSDFQLRLRHARRLLASGNHSNAIKHFRWCVARKPDPRLKAELRAAHLR